ncbi:hypothetical protein B0H19DRAFT_1065156 [Mycena capillaripes]|nr:hypothetical protein B0H19DRAFT_1065156 [Mycena capillaripes]
MAPLLPSHMEAQGRRGSLRQAKEALDPKGTLIAQCDVQPQEGGTAASPWLICHSPLNFGSVGNPCEPLSVTDPSDLKDTSYPYGSVPGSNGGKESTEQGDSITAALQMVHKGKDREVQDVPFFSGYGSCINLYLEDLPHAMEHYHIPFDPNLPMQEDPLILFGMHHGEVPGQDTAANDPLHDTVICYQSQNKHFSWVTSRNSSNE